MPEQQEAVLSLISDQETVELAQTLVRIPSITAEEGRELSDFLFDWLQLAGLSPLRQSVPPEPPEVLATSIRSDLPDPKRASARHNITAAWAGSEPGPRLLFEGHQDTKWVDGMTVAPFGAEIRDGRLYGRGAADMKGAIAAMMVAMKALRNSGVRLRGELWFASEVGEEINDTGIEALDGAGYLDVDMAVIGEPSNLAVQIGNRGAYRFSIALEGRAVHSGLAQQGINAIQKMSKIISGLYDLPFLQDDDPVWGAPTMNVQKIAGGGRWEASVADECTVWVDVRTTPRYPAEEVERMVRDMLQGLSDRDREMRCTLQPTGRRRMPQAIAPGEPLVQAALRAVRRVRGETQPVSACAGVTVAAMLIQRHHIPAVILGPGDLVQAHSRDEWAEVQQIADAARIYALLALDILSQGT